MGKASLAMVVVCALAGCLRSSTVTCADGRICPSGLECDDQHGACVLPEQLVTCGDDPDETPCNIHDEPGGYCQDGVCLRPRCGDGVKAPTEACEPDEELAIDCTDLGYYEAAPLGCGADCKFDTSACIGGFCGDDNVDGPEDCDTLVAGTLVADCLDLEYYDPGDVTCTSFCRYDVDACTGFCGDDLVNGNEQCEGGWERPETCLDFGFDAGRVECSPFCASSLSRCGVIGWRPAQHAATDTLTSVWGSSATDVWAIGAELLHWDGLGWTKLPGTPGFLNGISGTSASDVWAVGDAGVIAHHDGSAWSTVPSPVITRLIGVWAASASEAWAVGEGGAILHFAGDGDGWTTFASPTAATLNGIWGASDDDVWAVGTAGTILHYDGTSWTAAASPTGFSLEDVSGSDADHVWATGEGGTVLRLDGTQWANVVGTPALPYYTGAVWTSGPGDVWIGGDTGTLVHFDGVRWASISSPAADVRISGIWGTGPGNVLAVGGDIPSIWRYLGAAWTSHPTSPNLNDAWGASPDDVWAVGFNTLAHYDGRTWTATTPGAQLRGIWGSRPDDIWAVGGSGAIAHHDGAGWTPVASPTTADLFDVSGAGPDDVWAVGQNGTVLHHDGAAWTLVTPAPTTRTILAVWAYAPDEVWATTVGGTVVHFDGVTWTESAPIVAQPLTSVWGSSPDDVWAVGSDNTAVHHDGATWTVAPLPLPVRDIHDVWGSSEDDVWAVGAGGVLHFDGVGWSAVRSPTTEDLGMAWGTPATWLVGGGLRLDRTRPWSCRPQELACGDGVDDDCDGLIDAADPGCPLTIRLAEVATTVPGWIEVVNRSDETSNLHGISVAWQHACDTSVHRYSFPPDAIAAPLGKVRAFDERAVGRQEKWLDDTICDGSTQSGWAVLCDGPCDLDSCANVVDVLAVQGTGALPALPSCATFAPAPIDVTGAAAGDAVARTGFSGTGTAADWTLTPATRD